MAPHLLVWRRSPPKAVSAKFRQNPRKPMNTRAPAFFLFRALPLNSAKIQTCTHCTSWRWRAIRGKTERGYYADGGGLYFRVGAFDTRSWAFRFTLLGKAREMGLGAYPDVSLMEARALAAEAWGQPHRGAQGQAERRRRTVVRAVRRRLHRQRINRRPGRTARMRRNGAAPWKNTPTPVIGRLLVRDVTDDRVLQILEPETASRVRGRIESVLDTRRRRNTAAATTRPAGGVSSTSTCKAQKNRESEASPCLAIRRARRVHGGTKGAGGHGRPRAGARHPDRCPLRRGSRRDPARVRPRRRHLDDSGQMKAGNLWGMAVGRPGVMKSPALSDCCYNSRLARIISSMSRAGRRLARGGAARKVRTAPASPRQNSRQSTSPGPTSLTAARHDGDGHCRGEQARLGRGRPLGCPGIDRLAAIRSANET